jgi:hypothetical protein
MKKLKTFLYILVFCLIFLLYKGISYIINNGNLEALDTLDKSVISSGFTEMKNHKVIITGMTRDNITELPVTRKFVEKTGSYFQDYRVVVFENDSTDGTKEFLAKWQSKNDKVEIITHDFHNKKRPSIEFLAQARNFYIDAIANNPDYKDFDMLMIVDMDMQYGWDNRGIAHSFAAVDKWDAVCANGIFTEEGKMWDMFAFRNDEFPDCSGDNIQRGQKVYPVGSDFVSVRSCFNGMAFYKRKYVGDCRYESPGGDCEHVYFHQCLIDNGTKMFMNPSQLILYSHHRHPQDIKEGDLPKIRILRSIYKKYRYFMRYYYKKIDRIENYIYTYI